MQFDVYQADPIASGTVLAALAQRAFGSFDADDIQWRLSVMPEISVFLAAIEGKAIGFKAGYAATPRRYYSWLGGVDPDFRGHGVAAALMYAQHQWLTSTRYLLVETHVRQSNAAMIQVNLKAGLSVTGMFMKSGEPNLIMQREIVR